MLAIAKAMQKAIKTARSASTSSRVRAAAARSRLAWLEASTRHPRRPHRALSPRWSRAGAGYQMAARPEAGGVHGDVNVYGAQDPVATASAVSNEPFWRASSAGSRTPPVAGPQWSLGSVAGNWTDSNDVD